MTYRVTFTSKAKIEFNQAAIWWAENRSRDQAARWLDGFEQSIESLKEFPEKHSLAPEDQHVTYTLRHLLFGLGSRPTHRTIFRVRDDEVIIYGVRHVAQAELDVDEL